MSLMIPKYNIILTPLFGFGLRKMLLILIIRSFLCIEKSKAKNILGKNAFFATNVTYIIIKMKVTLSVCHLTNFVICEAM